MLPPLFIAVSMTAEIVYRDVFLFTDSLQSGPFDPLQTNACSMTPARYGIRNRDIPVYECLRRLRLHF
ncbi:MAG: hypothetical protein V7723_07170 [Sneathiella sp.]